MNITFIDTSVLTNLLNIPGKNEHAMEVRAKFKQIITDLQSGVQHEQFILPFAAIIETGNHISRIREGNVRRRCAKEASKSGPMIIT